MSNANDIGKLILRLVLGVLILFHGVSKIMHGPAFILGLMAKAGLPEVAGYMVYVGEVLAPLLLIRGLWTRAAALIEVINMAVEVLLVHTSQFFTVSDTGGWALELQGMYFFTALAIAPTATSMNPSATVSGESRRPLARSMSSASAANFPRTTSPSRASSPRGPNTFGKNAGWILPSITFASVTVSGPPRR